MNMRAGFLRRGALVILCWYRFAEPAVSYFDFLHDRNSLLELAKGPAKSMIIPAICSCIGFYYAKKKTDLLSQLESLEALLITAKSVYEKTRIRKEIERIKHDLKVFSAFKTISFGFGAFLAVEPYIKYVISRELSAALLAAAAHFVFDLYRDLYFKHPDKTSLLEGSEVDASDFPDAKITSWKVFKPVELSCFNLEDVVMPSSVRKVLRDLAVFLKDPAKVALLKAKIPRGILFSGPPGCGKTLIAKSFAASLGFNFISATGSDFVNPYVGSGARAVRLLFKLAQNNAPCVVFIDEIDSIGSKRNLNDSGAGAEYPRALNQMLSKLDGSHVSREWDGIFVIGATNMVESLDPALIRPGRLGKILEMGLPDFKSRLKMFEKELLRCKFVFENSDLEDLARESIGMSGAKIFESINQALIDSIKQEPRGGQPTLSIDLVFNSLERLQFGEPDDSLTDIDEAEKLTTAYHEAGHALVALLTPKANPLRKVTVVPRAGGNLGLTLCLPDKEFCSMNREQLEAQIRVSLGGLVAEKIVFGDHTEGVASDLIAATELAKKMVARLAMSEFGPLVAINSAGNFRSEAASAEVERISKELISKNLDQVMKLLQIPENRSMLEKLARQLLVEKTMNRAAVRKLLGLDSETVLQPVVAS
jgi:ATP-dependent metalloprotease FtsH